MFLCFFEEGLASGYISAPPKQVTLTKKKAAPPPRFISGYAPEEYGNHNGCKQLDRTSGPPTGIIAFEPLPTQRSHATYQFE